MVSQLQKKSELRKGWAASQAAGAHAHALEQLWPGPLSSAAAGEAYSCSVLRHHFQILCIMEPGAEKSGRSFSSFNLAIKVRPKRVLLVLKS